MFLMLLCLACQEYRVSYPLSDPKIQTNKSDLVGKWRFERGLLLSDSSELSYGTNSIEIRPFNLHEYIIKLVPDSIETASDVMLFRGFESQIDAVRYANMTFLEGVDIKPMYSIYKFEVLGEKLIFWGVPEQVFDSLGISITSISKHNKFMKKHSSRAIWLHQYEYSKLPD